MRSVELIEEIECDKKELRELEDKLRRLKIDIKVKEKELEKVKKQEIIDTENDYIKNVLGLEKTDCNVYILFDKHGNIKGSKNIRDFYESNPEEVREFGYGPVFEKWMKERKLYGHCSSSFELRHTEWYNMSLLEQLEFLGWDVRDNKLINLEW